MADATAKKWSEEEKNQFLMQAIAQMHTRGGSIDLNMFSIPNRTPKALSHLWAKIRKDNIAYVEEFVAKGNAAGATPTRSTPGGRKRTAQVADFKEGDDDEAPVTPVKRPRKTPAKPRAKAKPAPVIPAADEDELSAEVMPQPNPMLDLLNFEPSGFHYSAGGFGADEI
ncbi:hypothetical protein E0Z10_g10801 [Xylaria hypoxylon]|uniref:Myb-like domain-containing protein n=1 Tax=Xylaria hypoxylon TaxID=37992 RepID=A0A4Z0XZ39_9PEZI|nr:hypothetical protein E0Z10_g10801 [Xylaria hypoxylon]